MVRVDVVVVGDSVILASLQKTFEDKYKRKTETRSRTMLRQGDPSSQQGGQVRQGWRRIRSESVTRRNRDP